MKVATCSCNHLILWAVILGVLSAPKCAIGQEIQTKPPVVEKLDSESHPRPLAILRGLADASYSPAKSHHPGRIRVGCAKKIVAANGGAAKTNHAQIADCFVDAQHSNQLAPYWPLAAGRPHDRR